MATSLDSLHRLETAVAAAGVPVFARSRTTDDPGRLLGLLADENVADIILVPADAGYAVPGGTQSPAAPTARLTLVGDAGTSGAVRAHLGGESDRAVLEIGLRLAQARGQALQVDGDPGRKLAATIQSLRSSGDVVDTTGDPALEVRGGAPSRAATTTTVWVQLGRDDGAARLTELTDRLISSPTTGD